MPLVAFSTHGIPQTPHHPSQTSLGLSLCSSPLLLLLFQLNSYWGLWHLTYRNIVRENYDLRWGRSSRNRWDARVCVETFVRSILETRKKREKMVESTIRLELSLMDYFPSFSGRFWVWDSKYGDILLAKIYRRRNYNWITAHKSELIFLSSPFNVHVWPPS